MTQIVELDQAEIDFAELVQQARADAEVVITQVGRPVAKFVATTEEPIDREPGSAKGLFTAPDDFDAPLDEFREYM